MKPYPLLINRDFLLIVAIVSFFLLLFGAFLKITHWNIGLLTGNIVLSLALIPSLIVWFVVLLDIVRNPIENKLIIFLGLLFFGNIVTIFYLWKRETLLKKYN